MAGVEVMQLEQLIYVSRASSHEGISTDVSDILTQSLRHNKANHITGALAFTETHFIQLLEGSHSSLDVLLLRLLLDERHTDLEVLGREGIPQRSFAEWSMVSPSMTPAGTRQLVQLLGDDQRSVAIYRDLLLQLCAAQHCDSQHA